MKKVADDVKEAIRDSFTYDMDEVYTDDIDGRCACIRGLSQRFDVPFSVVERLVERIEVTI